MGDDRRLLKVDEETDTWERFTNADAAAWVRIPEAEKRLVDGETLVIDDGEETYAGAYVLSAGGWDRWRGAGHLPGEAVASNLYRPRELRPAFAGEARGVPRREGETDVEYAARLEPGALPDIPIVGDGTGEPESRRTERAGPVIRGLKVTALVQGKTGTWAYGVPDPHAAGLTGTLSDLTRERPAAYLDRDDWYLPGTRWRLSAPEEDRLDAWLRDATGETSEGGERLVPTASRACGGACVGARARAGSGGFTVSRELARDRDLEVPWPGWVPGPVRGFARRLAERPYLPRVEADRAYARLLTCVGSDPSGISYLEAYEVDDPTLDRAYRVTSTALRVRVEPTLPPSREVRGWVRGGFRTRVLVRNGRALWRVLRRLPDLVLDQEGWVADEDARRLEVGGRRYTHDRRGR